jgi:hypothetical protein
VRLCPPKWPLTGPRRRQVRRAPGYAPDGRAMTAAEEP